ncbi:MAG TPA: aminoacyl-tRNA hydrolase [Aquifex aeolicus]|uniref:Peptidyl-tRNA hydrolase n=1 Tax=Aquifex aeolicus TaxID=63363 RepID=A0A9D0YP47_AQUAO|nr:aminoacyl-tRNA hydrolase [Aquificales bacterium]HIP97964.1 aminoacyl-tRNA hydrolase [Aquifex aeolicus]HIQ26297.1 aminoacyl-tRNA hydrolase [Aquifex aeolicus]
MIRLIVGLGNPGERYRETRHNAGFMVIDHLTKRLKLRHYEECCFSHLYKKRVDGVDIYFAKPQTYMNLSGIAVKNLLNDLRLLPEEILVIHDDLDLPLGVTKIKFGGSSGGQKGVENIIKELGTKNFYRLRLGIGRPKEKREVVNYVLSPFSPEQRPLWERTVKKAGECVIRAITEGIEPAMNFCNRND